MAVFLDLIGRLPGPVSILDVGGTAAFWDAGIPDGAALTLINVFEQSPPPGVRAEVGDACDLSRFGDGSFDVVFSNSVLGHVGGWERQVRMAEEIRRVGRAYFVQTPNQRFPVDWRTLVPFFHWLSPDEQAWCLRRVRVGRYGRVRDPEEALRLASRVRNVTREEVARLFPGAAIVAERTAGFTKSFMVHDGFV